MAEESIQLIVGGERLCDLSLEMDDIVERLTLELASADAAATTDDDAAAKPLLPVTLVLRNRSWNIESMTKLVPFIETIASRVVAVEADDVIANQETRVGYEVMRLLAESLRHATKLRVVNLSDNALGPPTLENIRVILTPQLTSIKFYNCGVDTECMRILREALLGIPKRTEDQKEEVQVMDDAVCDLEELDCSRNTIGEGGAEQIGWLLPHCPNMKVFVYAGARPGLRGTMSIAVGLQQLAQRRRALAAADAATYPDASLQVRELNVSEGSYGKTANEAVGPLCEALQCMPLLQKLQLSDCGLHLPGLGLVIDALTASNAQLVHLNLADVGEIGVEGGKRLASLLGRYTATLQVLSLEGNDLGWKGLRALIPFFESCQTLETVNLSRNELGPRAMQELLKLSDSTPWKTLTLEENWFEDEDLQEQLQQHFSKAEVVFGEEQEEGDEDDDDEEEDDGGDEEEQEDGAADELTQELEHLNL